MALEFITNEQRVRYTIFIRDAALSLQIDINMAQVDAILRYLDLFIKWNNTYNLSAIRDPDEMISKHILDSLTLVPYLKGHQDVQRVIDVGTGGGLPGIPLAICFPDIHFTLLDSAGKKIRFLYQVKQSLKLSNVALVNLRVEKYRPDQLYDVVLTRAFASIGDMTPICRHLISENGRFWAMKGLFPEEELNQLEKDIAVEDNHTLNVPGLTGYRCLIVLKQQLDQLNVRA